ncbi:hypothetical protein [Saccharothrix sp. ST-888]|uniref:hypothetical protein n=1 Tax=Saccharothrix sp. ST-888 TaxID=1427391 RepID=UPI0005ECA696|nr:hypothetical protein [Saccharothrix sp. ST-888]KJK56282.1 hypothetical protein UK12_23630 [Saccharothrix sp. ST-888]
MTEQRTTPSTPPNRAPEPEPIRWFGTSWVDRGADYRVRRVLVPVGALVCTVAGALVLRFAVTGVRMSESGGFVYGLLIAAIAVCSCLAALRNWKLLAEGRESLTGWMAEDKSLGVVWLIGVVGALVAYFVRSLVEAPGESVKRAGYDQARMRYERRQADRGGRPGSQGRTGKRKR